MSQSKRLADRMNGEYEMKPVSLIAKGDHSYCVTVESGNERKEYTFTCNDDRDIPVVSSDENYLKATNNEPAMEILRAVMAFHEARKAC